MSDPASQTAQAAGQTAAPPRIPTGQELYDLIMAHIEPELTTEGLKNLKEKYKDENPEQLASRKQKYQVAFDRYEQAYQGYLATLQTQVDRFYRASFAQVEVEDRQYESATMQSLQQSLSV